MTYKWKFVFDTGRIVYIVAKTRKEAIEKYHAEYGAPVDFIKKTCNIVNEGEA